MGFMDFFKRAPVEPTRANQSAQKALIVPRMRGLDLSPVIGNGGGQGFAGAEISRLTGGVAQNRTPNADLRSALRLLRGRSRELARNSAYVKRYLHMVKSNVVGANGIRLQVQAREIDGTRDTQAVEKIEAAWKAWGKPGVCTMDRKLGWIDTQRLIAETIARDGEVLIRLVRGRQAGNPFNFAIHLLEADHLAEDNLQTDLRNGNIIHMSVEQNQWGAPVAYHVLKAHPGTDVFFNTRRQFDRLPAKEIIHPFINERAAQSRGVPWTAPVIVELMMLDGYREAELVAARSAAVKLGAIVSPDGEEFDGDDIDEQTGDFFFNGEPGSFDNLPPGFDLKSYDPQHPVAAFGDFVKAALRSIASGLNVSYNSLANDLQGVNFSSLRQGAIEERDHWRALQSWMVENVHAPIFDAWLEMALLGDQLNLPPRKIDKFRDVVWRPRGWQWVDPLKDGQAAQLEHALGIKSKTEIAAEKGRDLQEVVAEIAAENEVIEAAGINPQSVVVEGGNDDDDEQD